MASQINPAFPAEGQATTQSVRDNFQSAADEITGLQGQTAAIEYSLDLKAPLADPNFSGNPQAPTPELSDASASIATTMFVQNLVASIPPPPSDPTKAPLASPAFTGNPQAPTPATGDNDTTLATTAFVKAAIANEKLGSNVGQIVASAAPSVPAGYISCQGAAISRTTYANLFAAIGTTWGAGDGSTTFNVPNIPNNYTLTQGVGFEGSSYVGENITHAHNIQLYVQGGVQWTASASGTTPGSALATTASGGAANLAAGVRVRFLIKY